MGSALQSSVSWTIVCEVIITSLNIRITQKNVWPWKFSFRRTTYLPILVSVTLIILSLLNFGTILRHWTCELQNYESVFACCLSLLYFVHRLCRGSSSSIHNVGYLASLLFIFLYPDMRLPILYILCEKQHLQHFVQLLCFEFLYFSHSFTIFIIHI